MRLGFLEPDFRRPLTRLAHAEVTRPELAPLLVFAKAINDLYAAWRISPAVGASLAPALEDAGYVNVRHAWHPFVTDADVIENMRQIYDEVRDTFVMRSTSSRLLRSISRRSYSCRIAGGRAPDGVGIASGDGDGVRSALCS